MRIHDDDDLALSDDIKIALNLLACHRLKYPRAMNADVGRMNALNDAMDSLKDAFIFLSKVENALLD